MMINLISTLSLIKSKHDRRPLDGPQEKSCLFAVDFSLDARANYVCERIETNQNQIQRPSLGNNLNLDIDTIYHIHKTQTIYSVFKTQIFAF